MGRAYNLVRDRAKRLQERAETAERELEALKAALSGCWGQKDDGGIRFVVNVRGVGARPQSPQEVARDLCARVFEPAMWAEYGPLAAVRVDESSRAALEAANPPEDIRPRLVKGLRDFGEHKMRCMVWGPSAQSSSISGLVCGYVTCYVDGLASI